MVDPKFIFILFGWLLIYSLSPANCQNGENRISRTEYIEAYEEIAIEEMNDFHIPASITLAQGILESGNGNSRLAKEANNHFGIKCHKGWTGKSIKMDDDAKNECFRKYKNAETSYKDHSRFLSTRSRYAFLFDLKITDYKSWAKGLKKAGYATNPKYPSLLIKIIEDNKLYEYDKYYGKKYKGKTKKTTLETHSHTTSTKTYKEVTNTINNRKLYINNGVKFIYARKGDTFHKIAQEFNIYTFQVYKNNDMKKKDKPFDGQMLYLEPKKNSSIEPYHTVRPGENLFDISQEYGIKLKKLAKYNQLKKNAELFPDQNIKLKK